MVDTPNVDDADTPGAILRRELEHARKRGDLHTRDANKHRQDAQREDAGAYFQHAKAVLIVEALKKKKKAWRGD